ncbi:MAG: hypothetical protein RJR35_11395 [Thermoanaerobacterales bacterium]|nr:hypothetical protein [Thermoanaerobacterales bacterium]
MSINCEHWKEYDSISGPISYCEIAAFGHKLTLDELEKMGCTAEKRKLCKQKMEFTVGDAVTPKPDPQLAPVVIPNACDTPKAVAAITVGNAEKRRYPRFSIYLCWGFWQDVISH